MEIKAGQTRKRLTLLAPPSPEDMPRDSFGGQIPVASVTYTLWGNVEALSGRDFWQAQQAQVVFSHRVTVRYSRLALEIGKDWKIVVDGSTLEVMLPPRDIEGRRRSLEIMCQEAK